MENEEASLVIDVFKPSSMPMSRLADYLKSFAVLLGSEAHVHFERVAEGSAQCRATIEPHAAPKVRERLEQVSSHCAPKSAMKARSEIDNLLLEDNATGHVDVNGRKIIEFPGRMRAPRETIGPVLRNTFIEGQVFSIGGKDETINVYLKDGQREQKCIVSVELARRLGPHLRGPRIRFLGEGVWYRVDGRWEMRSFSAESFIALDAETLDTTLKRIRSGLTGVDSSDFLATMQELREG